MRQGQRIEIQVARSRGIDWIAGTVVSARAGGADEDFARLDVRVDDGRLFEGCHPLSTRTLVVETVS